MFLQSVDERYRKLLINCVLLSNEDEPAINRRIKKRTTQPLSNILEVLMHTTLHTVGLQSQVHISVTTEYDVVLSVMSIRLLAD